jgi:hypothetical protein
MKKVPLFRISGTLLRGERAGFGLKTAKFGPDTRCCGLAALATLAAASAGAGKSSTGFHLDGLAVELGAGVGIGAAGGGGGRRRRRWGLGLGPAVEAGGRRRSGLGPWAWGPGQRGIKTGGRPPGPPVIIRPSRKFSEISS